jgi:MFS transporter, DHA1 family, multidrug resistance protein
VNLKTIAPTVGGSILAIANWRAIYGLLAVVGLVLILTIALGLDESIKSRDLNAIKPHRLIGNYLLVLNNRVFSGVPSPRLLGFGLVIAATSAIALVLVSITGVAQLLTLLPLLIINTFCDGLIAPNAIHHALESVEDVAGSAAALIGFLEMLSGSLASFLIGFFFDGHTVNVMSEVRALFAIASLATYTQLQFHK